MLCQGVVGRSWAWRGEHRTPRLLSQASCCLAVGTSPCQAGQLGPNSFFSFSGGCTSAGAKHDMLGLNFRKASEHLSAAQVAARCQPGSWEGSQAMATCFSTRGSMEASCPDQGKEGSVLCSPWTSRCNKALLSSDFQQPRCIWLLLWVSSPPGSASQHCQPCPWPCLCHPSGWDGMGAYQGTIPSWLCFTWALMGAGMEFGRGWAFPCSDSPRQDLALMTVLCGEEIPEELLTAHWGMM